MAPKLSLSPICLGVVTAGGLVVVLLKRRSWLAKKEERENRKETAKRFAGEDPQLIATECGGQRMLTTFSKGIKPVTAVMIHGFGCMSMEWEQVIRKLEGEVSIFNYDRILFAEYDQLPSRDATVIVQELKTLLKARGVEPPYLLVGHSYGGLIAQYYAMCHPDQVGGMVLIDPANEDQFEKFPWDFVMGFQVIVPVVCAVYQNLAWTGILKVMDALSLFNFPPLFLLPKESRIRKVAADLYSDGSVWHIVAKELVGCKKTFRDMKELRRPLPQVPIGLVLASNRKYSPTLFPKAVTKAFLDMHKDLPAKTYLADSDHWVHMQQPQVVVNALHHVLSEMAKQSVHLNVQS